MPPSNLTVPDDFTLSAANIDLTAATVDSTATASIGLTAGTTIDLTATTAIGLTATTTIDLNATTDIGLTAGGDIDLVANGTTIDLTAATAIDLAANGIDMLALKGTSTPPIAMVYAPSTAPTDGDLNTNTFAPSIDETNDALRFRVKYSDGSLQTGILPFVPSTVTVGATGADFTSIQAAWNYLKGRLISSLVTIDVAAGTYTENVALSDQPFASLVKIQGDTRTAAGQHSTTTGSITKSGSDCTITLVNAPPSDFTSSDFVVIGGTTSAANVGRFPIVSIDVPNKKVTYTNASGVAEAVRVNTQVIFCPNRILDFSGGNVGFDVSRGGGTTIVGFTLISTNSTLALGIRANGATLGVNACCQFGLHDTAFATIRGGVIGTNANCSAVKCLYGFSSSENGALVCDNTYAADNTAAGYYAARGGFLRANGAVATNCNVGFSSQTAGDIFAAATASFNATNGFRAEDIASALVSGSTALNNGVGYYSTWQSLLVADSTSANNSGNTTNYSPATSGTEGNTSALIRWS
jgi:hypothetical protein